MFNKLLKLLLSVVAWLASIISSILLYPIYLLLNGLLDDFPNYLEQFNNFINYYLINSICFVKEVFLNCTGFPRTLFNALITLFLARLALRLIIIPFRFLIKIYYIIRGNYVTSSKE